MQNVTRCVFHETNTQKMRYQKCVNPWGIPNLNLAVSCNLLNPTKCGAYHWTMNMLQGILGYSCTTYQVHIQWLMIK